MGAPPGTHGFGADAALRAGRGKGPGLSKLSGAGARRSLGGPAGVTGGRAGRASNIPGHAGGVSRASGNASGVFSSPQGHDAKRRKIEATQNQDANPPPMGFSGARVPAPTHCTPLHDAAVRGHLDAIEALLNSPELLDGHGRHLCNVPEASSGRFPLHLACLGGHFEAAQALLDHSCITRSSVDSQGTHQVHLFEDYICELHSRRHNCSLKLFVFGARSPLVVLL